VTSVKFQCGIGEVLLPYLFGNTVEHRYNERRCNEKVIITKDFLGPKFSPILCMRFLAIITNAAVTKMPL
jgi:hypothetical protein